MTTHPTIPATIIDTPTQENGWYYKVQPIGKPVTYIHHLRSWQIRSNWPQRGKGTLGFLQYKETATSGLFYFYTEVTE